MATEATYKEIVNLGNHIVEGYTCSAVAAMTIENDKLYAIKTKARKDETDKTLYPVVFYKLTNFTDKATVSKTYCSVRFTGGKKLIANHANGLTSVSNGTSINFYVTTGNEYGSGQLLRFNESGIINQTYNYKANGKEYPIYSISYCGVDYETNKNLFIICVKKAKIKEGEVVRIKYRYHFVTIDNTTITYKNVAITFKGATDYIEGNDIYFHRDTEHLFITGFRKTGSTILDNLIYELDLSGVYKSLRSEAIAKNKEITKDYNKDMCVRNLHIKSKNGYKYEIEGVGIYLDKADKKNKKYVVANVNSSDGEGSDNMSVLMLSNS